MSRDDTRSAFDQLRQYYDQSELVCPDCGFEDDEGSWEGETDGSQVHYFHECPSCGSVREHTVSLEAD
jgi:predicted RNA-binding Zn-ribbon protein involved in translation (DUF1610 family)